MSFSTFAPASGGLPPSPQDERRARILDAARTCFSRAGFHRTSMQEICAEAKMSPAFLSYCWPRPAPATARCGLMILASSWPTSPPSAGRACIALM